MSKLILDPDLRAKLNGLNEQVEVCDEQGTTLGRFVPEEEFLEMLTAWGKAIITDEELERRANAPGGRSLREIWQRLGRTA